MTRLQKTFVILLALFIPLIAEEVMKITLSDNTTSKEYLSYFSRIIFNNNMMLAGASYAIDDIKKIEFYNDDPVSISYQNNHKKYSVSENFNRIGFTQTGNNLKLSLSKPSQLSVSLFSINGRKIAELYNGKVDCGSKSLNFSKYNMAKGFYSVVIKSDNSIFVRKLIIK